MLSAATPSAMDIVIPYQTFQTFLVLEGLAILMLVTIALYQSQTGPR